MRFHFTSLHVKLDANALVFFLVLGISQAAWAACVAPQHFQVELRAHPDAQTYTDVGAWFGDHGQYDCALQNLRLALKLQPDSAFVHYLTGLTLHASGDSETAVKELEQSISIAPNVLKPHLVLASAFDKLHLNQDAEAQWRAALAIDPASTAALDGLSNSLIADGDYTSAIGLLSPAHLNETLSLDLALAYGKAQMLDRARDTLVEALHANPSSLPLTNALVTVYVNQYRYQDAVQVAANCAQLHPSDLNAQRLYLRVLVLNHDGTNARPLGRRLLASHPHDFEFLYLNGILEREAGDYVVARKHLEEAIAINPAHPNCLYNLGVVLAQLKDPAGAKIQLEKSLTLGLTEPQARFVLANVLRSLGETEQAQQQLKLYQEEQQANATSGVVTSKSRQAEEALAAGDAQKAVALYRDALDAKPHDALLDFKLGMALDRTGDTTTERTVLEDAVSIDPTFALAQNQLGYLASSSSDFPTAEKHFRLAVQSAPGYTEAWVNLAAALAMQSRFSEASEAVSNALKLDPKNQKALELQRGLANAQNQH